MKIDIVSYSYTPTKLFIKKLGREKTVNPPGHKRIVTVIERLIVDPSDADGKMHGIHNGRFKKYVGRREYRLIYYYCVLCRKENKRLAKKCDNCESFPDNSVIFFDLYHKADMKKFKKYT